MKRIVTLLVAAFATLSLGFSETIHIKHAYLMKKDAEGHVYIIRVKEDTGYHDWYVRDSDNP